MNANCSRTKVGLHHNEYPGCGRSDYWMCDDCGTRFFPESFDLALRNKRAAFATAALPAVIKMTKIKPDFSKTPDEQMDELMEIIAQKSVAMADAIIKELE